jgi:hypothetical protein
LPFAFSNLMKLKHRIRSQILEQVANTSVTAPLTAKAIRKAIEGNFVDDIGDKHERKAAIVAEIEKLIQKGSLVQQNDGIHLTTEGIDGAGAGLERKRKASVDSATNTNDEKATAAVNTDSSGSSGESKKRKSDSLANESDEQADTVPRSKCATVEYSNNAPSGNNTILLFYAYCNPNMTRAEQVGLCGVLESVHVDS